MEEGESYHGPRVVIDHNADPPTEGPRLRKGERNPRNPEAGSSGYGREIDVPDITGMPSRDAAGLNYFERHGLPRYRFGFL